MRHYLDVLAGVIRENWHQPALTDYALLEDNEGNSYTYGEMYRMIVRIGDTFRQNGLDKGAHIAVCGNNSANWTIAYLAVSAYGGVVVTISAAQPTGDIVNQLVFSKASALIADQDILDRMDLQALPDLQFIMPLNGFSSLPNNVNKFSAERQLNTQDVHFNTENIDNLTQICFTSGSTSNPKGVMLSARSISNNVRNIIEGFPDDNNRAFLSFLPPSHMFGLMTESLGQLAKGKHIIFLGPLVSKTLIVDSINMVRPYAMAMIPAILDMLIAAKGIERLKELLSCCRQIHVGGASISNTSMDLLADSGIPVSVGYGVTEAGPLICDDLYLNFRPGSCGRAVPGMMIRIAEGEILVKGENVMLGYYKDPEATHRKIDADGWLHTGDAGYLDDDGYLYVTGRIENDMIVLPSGENVYPQNIEAIINSIDGVDESLVVNRSGKLVALIYASMPLDIDNLLSTINPELPLFSQLYDIEFVSEPFQKTAKQSIKRYLYR